MDLAKWLTARDNPLTARVAINRFWQQLFGVGLVKTSEDFGSQGESPRHPELLDYLALQFVGSGWDVKATMRSMVLSETYQQTSRARVSVTRPTHAIDNWLAAHDSAWMPRWCATRCSQSAACSIAHSLARVSNHRSPPVCGKR
ncbi:MAG: DUF1553 domain-containing protein [Pirellulaceae bacterium]